MSVAARFLSGDLLEHSTEILMLSNNLRVNSRFSVKNRTDVYAHLGDECINNVTDIEETLSAYVAKTESSLAGPPRPDQFVILCNRDIPCR